MGYVHRESQNSISYLETESLFGDWLDQVADFVTILGMEYNAGYVLKTIDPIAYREMYLNWVNAEYPDSEWDEQDD